MLKHRNDFHLIEDGRRMLSLTSVSDGTLLSCCRKAGIFTDNNKPVSFYEIDNIRQAWRLYTQSTLQSNYRTWIDCWLAFEHFAKHEASQVFITDLLMFHDVSRVNSSDHSIVERFDINGSTLTVQSNGLIVVNGISYGHCLIVQLDGIDVVIQGLKKSA